MLKSANTIDVTSILFLEDIVVNIPVASLAN